MFGGDALAAMTKAAFVAASRRSRTITVLASSRRTDFKHPIPVGSIIDVVAEIVQTGSEFDDCCGRALVGDIAGRPKATDCARRIRHGVGRFQWPAGGPSARLVAETGASVPGGGHISTGDCYRRH